jgi:muramoyltetrapeptide carboxypeptidase
MMKPILPPRLKPGQTIGLVSPSSPVTPELEDQLARGIACLQRMGFNVQPGDHIRSQTLGYAALPQEKAADIHRMFADDSINAIFCTQGGMTANACLPYLDWNLIRSHPKIFLGISDITVLLIAIQVKTGLVTFHGDDVLWGLGRDPGDYELLEFQARLCDCRIGPIPAHGERKTVRGGKAEGILLGGNLRCLLNLVGTSCWPDFRDGILFVEALDISPEKCDYMFRQLEQIGIFGQIRGAVVGYVDGLQRRSGGGAQMEDILLRTAENYDFPILKVNDFGHNCQNTVLPVGGRLRMDADERTLEIVAPCVA